MDSSNLDVARHGMKWSQTTGVSFLEWLLVGLRQSWHFSYFGNFHKISISTVFFLHFERMLCTYIWHANVIWRTMWFLEKLHSLSLIHGGWPKLPKMRTKLHLVHERYHLPWMPKWPIPDTYQLVWSCFLAEGKIWISLSFSHIALRSEWFKFLLVCILVAINDLCAPPFNELKDLCRTFCWTVCLVWHKECPDGYYKFGEGDVGRICKVCKAPCNTCLGPDLCTEYPGSASHLDTSSFCF